MNRLDIESAELSRRLHRSMSPFVTFLPDRLMQRLTHEVISELLSYERDLQQRSDAEERECRERVISELDVSGVTWEPLKVDADGEPDGDLRIASVEHPNGNSYLVLWSASENRVVDVPLAGKQWSF
ncbi:hypothetical protein [Amycolatopsis sp. NPDC004378]